MPYPLPPGDAYTDVLRWFLVAVPDKPEYVRAAQGAYTEFTKWYIWERDEAKRGADAADAWDEAVAATLEALEMGFPDILLGHIDEVEDLLRGLQAVNQITAQCCDNLGPLNETAETDLEPGGTPPATWGDETVADADDWAELVCGAAHAYVDYLKAMATELETFVTLGAIAIGGIAALLSIGAGAGILLKISYGAAATVVSGLIASATVGLFGDVPDDLEAARADIVCEIVHGDVPGMEAAIEASMSALAWSLFYQYVDYASARNIMLEGSHGEENLGVNRRTDCECAEDLGPFVFWDNLPEGGTDSNDTVTEESQTTTLFEPAAGASRCGFDSRRVYKGFTTSPTALDTTRVVADFRVYGNVTAAGQGCAPSYPYSVPVSYRIVGSSTFENHATGSPISYTTLGNVTIPDGSAFDESWSIDVDPSLLDDRTIDVVLQLGTFGVNNGEIRLEIDVRTIEAS